MFDKSSTLIYKDCRRPMNRCTRNVLINVHCQDDCCEILHKSALPALYKGQRWILFRESVFPSRVTAKQYCNFNKLIKPTATDFKLIRLNALVYITYKMYIFVYTNKMLIKHREFYRFYHNNSRTYIKQIEVFIKFLFLYRSSNYVIVQEVIVKHHTGMYMIIRFLQWRDQYSYNGEYYKCRSLNGIYDKYL